MRNFPRQKLQTMLAFVFSNKYSDFYQNLWEKAGLSTCPTIDIPQDWSEIPLLSRSDITNVKNPDDRMFVALKDHMLWSTSGTSGSGALFLWREIPNTFNRSELYRTYGATKLMLFHTYQKFLLSAADAYQHGMQSINGDAHNLERSALIAVQSKTDTLVITPTLGILFADFLDTHAYTKHITHIVLWGEYCSHELFKALQKRYPEAFFIFEYGLSEASNFVGHSTSQCEDPSHIFHAHTSAFYSEIVDGELVITTLPVPHAMPLMRYRTGDAARFIDESCPCGNTEERIEILGRINGDFIRIAGGEIRTEELDRVMEPFLPYLEPTYSLHVAEEINSTRKTGVLSLFVTKKPGISTPESSLAAHIAREVSNKMRLSQNMHIKNAVAADLLTPLTVTFTKKPPAHIKHQKLVRKF